MKDKKQVIHGADIRVKPGSVFTATRFVMCDFYPSEDLRGSSDLIFKQCEFYGGNIRHFLKQIGIPHSTVEIPNTDNIIPGPWLTGE